MSKPVEILWPCYHIMCPNNRSKISHLQADGAGEQHDVAEVDPSCFVNINEVHRAEPAGSNKHQRTKDNSTNFLNQFKSICLQAPSIHIDMRWHVLKAEKAAVEPASEPQQAGSKGVWWKQKNSQVAQTLCFLLKCTPHNTTGGLPDPW